MPRCAHVRVLTLGSIGAASTKAARRKEATRARVTPRADLLDPPGSKVRYNAPCVFIFYFGGIFPLLKEDDAPAFLSLEALSSSFPPAAPRG